jgi:hypothetical protein
MEKILNILIKDLDYEVKKQITQRYANMVSNYNHLRDSKDKNLMLTFKHKWNDDKYKVLFALNSFYQFVIGPLVSSAYGHSNSGLGSSIPINFGKMRIDQARNWNVIETNRSFTKLFISCGFNEYMMVANKVSDIAYHLAKNLREGSPNE